MGSIARKRFRQGAFSAFLFIGLCTEHPTWGQWRPEQVPVTISAEAAAHIAQRLTYSSADKPRLYELALSLDPKTATPLLRDYIAEYFRKNAVTDTTWGAAVFSLGLTQTQEAKAALLALWTEYDQKLAKDGRSGKGILFAYRVGPLNVIGDGLHLFVWQPDIRDWFLDQIAEGESMREPSELFSASRLRKHDRLLLMRVLYYGDIVMAADGEPYVRLERIMPSSLMSNYSFRNYNLPSPFAIHNLHQAAAKVMYWVKRLPTLSASASEADWFRSRRSVREVELSEVVARAGAPLGLQIWEDYLQSSSTEYDEYKPRLWNLAGSAFMSSLYLTTQSTWSPNQRESRFLQDFAAYTQSSPDGHMRRMSELALYAATAYLPQQVSPELAALRDLSHSLLDEDNRQQMESNISRARQDVQRRLATTQPAGRR